MDGFLRPVPLQRAEDHVNFSGDRAAAISPRSARCCSTAASYTVGTGAANQPHTTGNVGFECGSVPTVTAHHRIVDDRPLSRCRLTVRLPSSFAAPPPTASPISASRLPNYSQAVNYNQQQFDLIYDLTSKITLRGGCPFVLGRRHGAGRPTQPDRQPGHRQTEPHIGLGGFTYRAAQKLSVNLDYEGSSSDNIYFRTSLNDYSKGRARAQVSGQSALSHPGELPVLNNQNPDPDIRYDFLQPRQFALTIFWTPNSREAHQPDGRIRPLHRALQISVSYAAVPRRRASVVPRQCAHRHAPRGCRAPGLTGAKLTMGGSLFISNGQPPHPVLSADGAACASRRQARILEHRVAVLRVRGAAAMSSKASGLTFSRPA